MRPADGTPRVSIVVPAYNHGQYVEECIRSVLDQTYPQVELIVVDDGSTDETARIVQSYADRCRVVRQANAGQSRALNRGWALAHGDILAYLSDDDVLRPEAVAAAVAVLLERREAVMAYCDYVLLDPRSRPIRRVRAPDYSFEGLTVRLVCAPGPGAFFWRSAYRRAGPWDESLLQIPDFEFWLRLALCGPFVRIPRVLAGFRVHEDSQSFRPPDVARAEEPVRIIERHFARDDLPPSLRRLRREALSHAHILSARFHLRSGAYREFKGHMAEAFRLHAGSLAAPRTARLVVNGLLNRPAHIALWRIRQTLTRRDGHV